MENEGGEKVESNLITFCITAQSITNRNAEAWIP